MTSKNPSFKVFVVIPAFNEEKTIAEVVSAVLKKIKNIIVVNDGSSDNTARLAKKAGAIVINHAKNMGYEKALSNGFNKAIKMGADVVVTFDSDGESLASEIAKILAPIKKNEADVVVGERKNKNHFAEKILALYTNIFYGISDPLCGMKAYKRKVYKRIGHFDTFGAVGTQLALEAAGMSFKVKQVRIKTAQRPDKSRYYNRVLAANLKVLRALFILILKKFESKLAIKNARLDNQ